MLRIFWVELSLSFYPYCPRHNNKLALERRIYVILKLETIYFWVQMFFHIWSRRTTWNITSYLTDTRL